MPVSDEMIADVNAAIEIAITESSEVSEEENKEVSSEVQVESGEKGDEVVAEADAGSNSTDDKELDTDSSREPSGEPEVKGAVVVKPVRQIIGDESLARAVRAGLSVGVVRSFPSEIALNEAVSYMEQVIEAQKPPKKQEEEEDPFANIAKLDPEKFEPEVIEMRESLLAVLKSQHEEIRAMKASAAEQSQQSAQVSQSAVTREITEWFDKEVGKLGKDFHTVLGEGGMDSLVQGSPQFLKREEIANRVAISMAGYNAQGIQAPPRDELFREAASLALGDEYQKVREKKLSGDLAKRSKQHIQRADGRQTKSNQSPFEEVATELDSKFFARK